jgi:hypothetical protein
MNLYNKPIVSRRDPLGMAEGVTDQGPAIARATACAGGWLDIGVSASSSSGANAGDSSTGSFLVGSNSVPIWVWIVAAIAIVFLLRRK